jgi:hypothetical protein
LGDIDNLRDPLQDDVSGQDVGTEGPGGDRKGGAQLQQLQQLQQLRWRVAIGATAREAGVEEEVVERGIERLLTLLPDMVRETHYTFRNGATSR